ncbi:2-hydroxyacyl-CoA dehydratase family protein [Anaerovorax odorimutans]|uniref:2-hydroxyacyl-CoA dehydratase family protein n=1 Tax=Anaerovorax odorimutans TaxID=109327 RepID=A0ABT1RT17_9FIRM|nr:2-hydroxyacyl-CoA dehydratase family protein [Anaerovorax odorimutans]MCQ4638305.1 2-hydroxyacyl-CoA dehydratase family protein [Anaerovorax odorimutans]
MSYQDIIKKLETAALHPAKTVTEQIRKTGKDAFGCFPIYTPEEIIYAAGLLPVGMWGGKTELKLADKYLQSFCCSIMRSNIEYGLKGTYNMLKGIILPTFCDTLKCICENWKAAVPHIPIVPIVYPQNRSIDAGFVYMTEELQRVKGEMEKITGRTLSDDDLEEAWELYEEYRRTMREFTDTAAEYPQIIGAKRRHLLIKAGYFMDKREYTQDIREIIAGLKDEEKKPFAGNRVVVTGLLAEPAELLDIFEENQLAFAADDLAQESRQFRTPGGTEGSVWQRMAGRICDQRGDTFLYEEEKSRGQMLIDMVKEKEADAVVIFMMKFCDPEEFDYPIYKKELEAAGIPMLYLEIDQQMDSFEQIRTRVQSFAEMLA